MHTRPLIRCFLLAATLACLVVSTGVAKPDPAEAKRADIRKLMNLTGAGAMGKQVTDQMLGTLRQSMPQIPAEAWDSFANAINANELIEMVVPIYEKNLSHKDIKAIIAFYETPAGQRMIQAMPAITQESMVAGQKWGTQIMQKILGDLQAKGLLQ